MDLRCGSVIISELTKPNYSKNILGTILETRDSMYVSNLYELP